MTKGIVKWFNNEKKFGFILYEGEKEAFVHFSEIMVEGYKTLRKGDEVEFDLEKTDKGQKAVRVQILKSIKNKKVRPKGLKGYP